MKTRENDGKNIFLPFTISMVVYCIAYSTIRNFATLFMRAQGFSNTEVGIFFSLGALFSIVSQLALGTLLDANEKLTPKHLLVAATWIAVLDAVLLMFSGMKWVIFAAFVLINTIMILDKALYNMFGLGYVNAGYDLDYSLSRGIGSISTTGFTILTGVMIGHFTERYIFVVFFVAQVLLLLVLKTLPYVHRGDKVSEERAAELSRDNETALDESGNRLTVTLLDPSFWILLLSILIIYSCYNAGNNFHINIIESLGGGSRELGISDAVMAVVELPAMAAFLPLSKFFSFRRILVFSMACFVLKVVAFAFATNVYHIYLAQVLQLFSYGLFIPASAYYFNQILSDDTHGRGQALLGVFTSGLSGLLTSPIIGMILDYFPVKDMLLMASAVAILGIVGAFFSTERIKNKLHLPSSRVLPTPERFHD